MHRSNAALCRRRMLAGALALVGAVGARAGLPALAATGLAPTPRQTRGAFYPPRKPLDSDNDLVTVEGRTGRAQGNLLHVMGRVLDPTGKPVRAARVEIWQTNAFGRYHHPSDRRDAPLDPDFQGYGRDVADDEGHYRFRTVEPVAYPASGSWMRPPHIHFAISGPGFQAFTTQMYFAGNPYNAKDGLLNSIRDPDQRARLVVTLEPAPAALDAGAQMATFDIVLRPQG